MSFLGGLGRTLAGVHTLGLSEPLYFGPKDQKEDAERYRQEDLARQEDQARKLEAERERKRTTSLNLLGEMTGPQQSDAQKRRIAALESESAEGPLSQDALFQGDRARLVSGGQEALSGVQNTQRAAGTTGGFSNQGSIQDVYDRLGVGLAQLGQTSRQVKETKRDQATELQQAFVDAQTNFANAQTNAKIAIEQGDADAAAQYLQQAYQARQAVENAYRQQLGLIDDRKQATYGALIGAGAKIGGAAVGGPAGAKAGGAVGESAEEGATQGSGRSPYSLGSYDYGYGSNSPTWASLRGR